MDGSESDALVALSNVTKTYDIGRTFHAVDDVSLSLPPNSYTAIMGPSGSGKSSLLNLIGCLDTPTSGSVRLGDEDVSALSERKRTRVRGRDVGFVFQSFNLLPRLTALENVTLKLVFGGVPIERGRSTALELLEDVGLADRAHQRPTKLSGGEKQRVALARALVNDPLLVLADEPTGNLDSGTSDRILSLFDDLYAEGNSLVVVTHAPEVAAHAERIVHFRDGRIERISTNDGESPERLSEL